MEKKITIDVNKIILVMMVIFMIMPYSIKIFNISIIKIVSAIIFCIFVYLFWGKKDELKDIQNNKFILSNILFILAIIISVIINYKSFLFNDLFEILRYAIYCMITLITFKICKDKKYCIYLLKVISIAMIIIGVFGIIQFFDLFSINELYLKTYAPIHYKTLINEYSHPRIVGVKANPSVYGLLMTFGIYFNLMYIKHAKNKKTCYISIGICSINLIMTLTRTIQIAFIISMLVYILINTLSKKGWKEAITFTTLAILCIMILLLILPKSLTWRFTQIFNFSKATSWIGRIEKWKTYVKIIKENILFGVGPIKNYTSQLGYIDSELIQNLLQYGIIGIVAYIMVLFSPIYSYLKSRIKNKKILAYYLPILCVLIINNIAATSLIQFDTAIAVYIIIALILIPEKEDNDERIVSNNGGK